MGTNTSYYNAEAALQDMLQCMDEAELRAILVRASERGSTAFNRELFPYFGINEDNPAESSHFAMPPEGGE